MFGIKKRLEQIEYRLARIDKMLEEQSASANKSIVIHKPTESLSTRRRRSKNGVAIGKVSRCIRGRYKSVDQITAETGLTRASINTYIKLLRKSGHDVMTRGYNPTEYKLAKGSLNDG